MRRAGKRQWLWLGFMASVAFAWAGSNATAQTVTYSFGAASNLLDSDFYTGMESPGSVVVEAPSGRGILNIGVNPSGTKALFWAIDLATFQHGLFTVTIGSPSSWERVTVDQSFAYNPIVWCGDGVHAFVGNGLLFNTNTNVLTQGHELTPGFTYGVTGITRKPTQNWIVATAFLGDGILRATPVLNNGQGDTSRLNVDLTNFTIAPTERLAFPFISREGDDLVFQILDDSGAPDISNVYRLSGIDDIIEGNTSPPASLADGRINEIRASSTVNYACCSSFSFDNSLVFTTEDYLNVFDAQDFFATVVAADWDINITNADGTGYVQFAQPMGQGSVSPFPTGNRLHFIDQYNVYATTLTVENDIDAESDPLPDGGTTAVINGNSEPLPFVLTDSAVQATTDVTVADASGTVVELPVDQVINFPDGSGATGITIFTPIDPVAPIELPNPETAIPVIREFGPDGTQFFPPITVTITYTDEEVASITDESQMIPYLYDSGSQTFEPLCDEGDTACLAGIVVDTVNNTLTFQTDHFSTYGLGGPKAAAPQRPWAIVVTTIALAAMTLIALGVRMRGRKS